ncbi:hypothetical protein TN53_42640, partial [Streptomyces sp. WM6386]
MEYLSRYAESWRRLDAAQFPFVHEIADEFAEHDDRDQFLAALELTLAGLRSRRKLLDARTHRAWRPTGAVTGAVHTAPGSAR